MILISLNIHRSYAGWITNMSGIDDRLLKALRAIRQGDWVYGVSILNACKGEIVVYL